MAFKRQNTLRRAALLIQARESPRIGYRQHYEGRCPGRAQQVTPSFPLLDAITKRQQERTPVGRGRQRLRQLTEMPPLRQLPEPFDQEMAGQQAFHYEPGNARLIKPGELLT